MGRVAQVICFAVRASLATVCASRHRDFSSKLDGIEAFTSLHSDFHLSLPLLPPARIPHDCYFLLGPGTGAVTREAGVKQLPQCWPISCRAGNSTAHTANVKPLPHR